LLGNEVVVDDSSDEMTLGEMRNTVIEREGSVKSSRRFDSASLAWKTTFKSTHWIQRQEFDFGSSAREVERTRLMYDLNPSFP